MQIEIQNQLLIYFLCGCRAKTNNTNSSPKKFFTAFVMTRLNNRVTGNKDDAEILHQDKQHNASSFT